MEKEHAPDEMGLGRRQPGIRKADRSKPLLRSGALTRRKRKDTDDHGQTKHAG
jgi:hypothetical protein